MENEMLYKIAYYLEAQGKWDYWYESSYATVETPGLGASCKVVHREEDPRQTMYGDEYEQGSEGEIYLVIEADFGPGHVHYVKKSGFRDSYGETTRWSGPVVPVAPVEVRVRKWVED